VSCRRPAAWLVAGAVFAAAPSARATPQWAGTETRAHPVGSAVFSRSVADDEAVPVLVVLRVRDRQGLERVASSLTNPRGPAFRRWLDRDEVLASYAPTEAQAGAVADYLARAGFTDVAIEPGRLLVCATGSGRAIRQAFDTELAHFARDGRDGIANTRDVRVPLELGDAVLAVLGLQTLDGMHPLSRRAASARPLAAGVQGLDPLELPVAYDAAALPAATATSVAVVTDGDMTQTLADLQTFESQEGLPLLAPLVVTVGRHGHDTSGTSEWDIDSQDIQAMAGGQLAQLVFYAAHSLADPDLTQTFNQIVTDDSVAIVNVSLGECESVAASDGSMAADDQIFALAVAQGQTLSVASGDSGAPECGNPPGTAAGASYPASSPYVIAVGGTTLATGAAGSYAGETVWVDAGGSPSLYEPEPAWQSGVVAGGFRGVPDLAFDADPNSGAIVVVTGQLQQWGGTSLASPIFVGAWARIQTANGARLGFPAAWLYGRGASGAAALHDVLSGSNGGYGAAVGWDYASGFGSFDVAAAALLTRSAVTVGASPPTIAPGESVVLTATVSGNAPTGTAQFMVNAASLGAPVPLVAGVATLSTTSLTELGTYSITASYSGDGNDAPSASTPILETVAEPKPIPVLPSEWGVMLAAALLAVALAGSEAELQLRGFRHHRRVPRRLPGELHVDVRHARHAAQLLLDLGRQALGDGAHRRGERHAHLHVGLVVDVDGVDEPELVDVDRDLGIVDGAEHLDHGIADGGHVAHRVTP